MDIKSEVISPRVPHPPSRAAWDLPGLYLHRPSGTVVLLWAYNPPHYPGMGDPRGVIVGHTGDAPPEGKIGHWWRARIRENYEPFDGEVRLTGAKPQADVPRWKPVNRAVQYPSDWRTTSEKVKFPPPIPVGARVWLRTEGDSAPWTVTNVCPHRSYPSGWQVSIERTSWSFGIANKRVRRVDLWELRL
jgi:hypothetical protein